MLAELLLLRAHSPAATLVPAGPGSARAEPVASEPVASESAPARRLANPWASWVKGSWVEFDIQNSLTGGMTSRQSLEAVDDTTYTLRDETSWEGGSADKQVHTSLARFGYPHALKDGQKVATETLTIAGREIECEVWRARFTEDGETWDTVAWVSSDHGHPLRIKTKSKLSLDLEVTVLEDYVTISRRKFRCMRYEGTILADGKRTPVTQWRSDEIPGGLAKSVTTISMPQGKVTHTLTVSEFRGTKQK